MLKDHNCPEAIKLAESSYYHEVKKEAFKKKIVLPKSLSRTKSANELITNLVIKPNVPKDIREKIKKALNDIKFTRLEVNVVEDDTNITGKIKLESYLNRLIPSSTLLFFVIPFGKLKSYLNQALCHFEFWTAYTLLYLVVPCYTLWEIEKLFESGSFSL